jgi:hypothetical protein
MAKIILLAIACTCLYGCASTQGESEFNLGSMAMGRRTELQLRLENPSADAVSYSEKLTVEMEQTNSNLDSNGLGIAGIWRF